MTDRAFLRPGKSGHETDVQCIHVHVCTVPVKCKLTVTRNSNDSTLDPRNSKTSSIESRVESFEFRVESFEFRVEVTKN